MRFVLALVVIGGVLLFLGIQELRLSSAAKVEPQQITCAELAAKGPGDNAHVEMGEFLLCTFAFVYEEKNNRWQKVWVPAVPIGGEFHQQLLSKLDADGKIVGDPPIPSDVRVIVKASKVANSDELSALGDQETLQGVVINQIESLGSEERKILKESYPAVDFENCWILEAGRKPATMGKIAGLCGGGAALVIAGIAVALRSRAQNAAPARTTFSPTSTSNPVKPA